MTVRRPRCLQYADILRVFMLAPELPGALDLVAALTTRPASCPRPATRMAQDTPHALRRCTSGCAT